MIKNLFSVIFISATTLVFAQKNKDILKQIDSISQQRWGNVVVDLDSLNEPTYEKIDKKLKDTLIIKRNLTLETYVPQEELPITPFNFIRDKASEQSWFFFGNNSLTFNQSSFSNWNAGGNNSIGVIGRVNYNLYFKRNRHYLENNLQLGYGFMSQENQSTRKTEDQINISSNYGYDLGKFYYLSAGAQFVSQFTRGYNYGATPNPTKRDRISQFMAPGYLNLGLGISYNPKENIQIIFRPINGQFTFVTDPLLQVAGKYGLERDGQSVRSEIGARLNIIYRLKVFKDIHYTSNLNFFSNYLSHFERVDISYAGILNMKFNKYINATVNIDLLYDHDQMRKLQRKQTLGIGLVYNMGAESNKKSNSKMIKPFVK